VSVRLDSMERVIEVMIRVRVMGAFVKPEDIILVVWSGCGDGSMGPVLNSLMLNDGRDACRSPCMYPSLDKLWLLRRGDVSICVCGLEMPS